VARYAYVLVPRYEIDDPGLPIGVWAEKWLFVSWFKHPQPGNTRLNPEHYRLFRYCGAKPPVEMNLHDVVA
jgi:hypothetical protein